MMRSDENRNWQRSLAILSVAATILIPSPTHSETPEDILIISNKLVKAQSISVDEVRDLFLKRRVTWQNGDRAIPINAPFGSDLQKDFQRQVLGMTRPQEQRYWQNNQIKSGLTPPAEFSNTLKAVYKVKRSISYIYRSQFKDGVAKILLIIPAK